MFLPVGVQKVECVLSQRVRVCIRKASLASVIKALKFSSRMFPFASLLSDRRLLDLADGVLLEGAEIERFLSGNRQTTADQVEDRCSYSGAISFEHSNTGGEDAIVCPTSEAKVCFRNWRTSVKLLTLCQGSKVTFVLRFPKMAFVYSRVLGSLCRRKRKSSAG